MSTVKNTRLCFKFHFLLVWGGLTSGGPVHARVTCSGLAGDGGWPRLLCPMPTTPRSTQGFLFHLQTLPTLTLPLNRAPQSEAPEVQWDPETPRRTAVKIVTPPYAGSVLGSPTRPPSASEQPHWGDTQKGSGLHGRPPGLICPEQRGTVLPTEGHRAGEELQPPQPNLFPRNPSRPHQLLTFGAWSTCHGYAPSPCIRGWDSWEETSGSSHLGVAPCGMGTGSESHPRPSPWGVEDCLQTVHLRTAACSLQKINEITHPI